MSKEKEIGICPMCAYSNDTARKELLESHVVPHSVFRSMKSRIGEALGHRLIELPFDADGRIHITQEQGKEPMLCFACEQRLSKEIEKPALEWARNQWTGVSVDADSVLLARYVASVWWRAMWSNHRFYGHIAFDGSQIRSIMQASLEPLSTLRNLSVRIRKLVDSSGGFSLSALGQFQATMSAGFCDERFARGHTCFTMIHEGYSWEAFWPRLSRINTDKLKCLKVGRTRYALETCDFVKEPILLHAMALQLAKHDQDKITPAFVKYRQKTQ